MIGFKKLQCRILEAIHYMPDPIKFELLKLLYEANAIEPNRTEITNFLRSNTDPLGNPPVLFTVEEMKGVITELVDSGYIIFPQKILAENEAPPDMFWYATLQSFAHVRVKSALMLAGYNYIRDDIRLKKEDAMTEALKNSTIIQTIFTGVVALAAIIPLFKSCATSNCFKNSTPAVVKVDSLKNDTIQRKAALDSLKKILDTIVKK